MSALLVLVHTISPLISTFDHMAAEIIPGTRLKHILDELLLERILQRGHLSTEDTDRLLAHVRIAEQVGAAAVLVTCSTVSPVVDEVRPRTRLPVLKIDEAMIAAAVNQGSRIGVLATNPTTLEPTSQLLRFQAQTVRKQIEIEPVLIQGAFEALLGGDSATHDRLIKEAVLALGDRVEVIILAQASMARALPVIPLDRLRVPLLTSPQLALEQAKRILSESTSKAG